MTTCLVRWRSSGGRGEFEYVPSEALEDRAINIFVESLDVTIPAEVNAVKAQGKPRLRKFDANDRGKLHLPQLVMAIARLPEPAREDISHRVTFPLKNRSFVMDEMAFDVIDDDGITATLAPLRVSIRNSNFAINLQDRLRAISSDENNIESITNKYPELGLAIHKHLHCLRELKNTVDIRKFADEINRLQDDIFGNTNAGSVTALDLAESMPKVDLEEDFTGKEGKLLTRLHAYKERDKKFATRVKALFKAKNGGKIFCEACGFDPVEKYGPQGEQCLEAHHKIPIEELQPDSVTTVDQMAILCANCHRVVHSQKPCLDVTKVIPKQQP